MPSWDGRRAKAERLKADPLAEPRAGRFKCLRLQWASAMTLTYGCRSFKCGSRGCSRSSCRLRLASIKAETAALSEAPAAAVSAIPAAASMPDYKNYQEYYAGNPEALSREYIRTNANPDYAIQSNPSPSYQYRNDYNKYLSTLPTEYQALGKSNVTGESVRKGLITGVYDPATKRTYSVGPGVAPGTVKAGAAPVAAAATPARAPVNPGSNAPWQKSQQYWKDLAAYNAGR